MEPTLNRLAPVARRLFWWKSPEEALEDKTRFLAQVMALGTWDDVALAKSAYPPDAWKEALREAPPGVIDARSWHYWHNVFRMTPIPPLPTRRLPQE